MLVTILDVETTGLNPDTDAVIEVAAILYSVEHRAILQQVSTLLPVEENPAYETNGISPDMADLSGDVGWDSQDSISNAVREMMEASDYIVAFKREFNKAFVEARPSWQWGIDTPWSDAADITYPKMGHKRDLVNIALANGIPVVNAHRALDDCRLVAELLGKVPDLKYQLARAARPKVLVKALVSYENRNLASEQGFRWDRPDLIPRAWAKRMPAEDAEALPFAVEVVG